MIKLFKRIFYKEYFIDLQNSDALTEGMGCWIVAFNVFDAVKYAKAFSGSDKYKVKNITRL